MYPQLFFQVIMYFSMIEVGLSAQKWSAPSNGQPLPTMVSPAAMVSHAEMVSPAETAPQQRSAATVSPAAMVSPAEMVSPARSGGQPYALARVLKVQSLYDQPRSIGER